MSSENEFLSLKGVTENNLKNISIDLPHDKLIVVTGVSGSGKSTLAFDTIYAEGGRRYIETFSPYTRQFLSRLHRPQLSSIDGVRSALALEQRNTAGSSRSTVGTVTEINDYLKLLWSKRSELYCPECKGVVEKKSSFTIAKELAEEISEDQRVYVCAGVSLSGKAKVSQLAQSLESAGFVRFYSRASEEVKRLAQLCEADIANQQELLIVLDRLVGKDTGSKLARNLSAGIAQAFEIGQGSATIIVEDLELKKVFYSFKEGYCCDNCDISYKAPYASLFSFNSPLGACESCQGFGKILEIDPDICVPNKGLSLEEGAVQCWNTDSTQWERDALFSYCKKRKINTKTPWRKLSAKSQKLIFDGDKKHSYDGIYSWFSWLETKKYKMHVRIFLSRYRSERLCPECNGTRLRPYASCFEISGKTLPDIWQMSVSQLCDFFSTVLALNPTWSKEDVVLSELMSRLNYLDGIGLGYLTLDRQTRTLSGGEFQRVSLTAILGSQLVNTTLVLDEPTIGLHSRDTDKLIKSISELKDRGNTVVVVEHDREVISQADEIIDIGPDAGSLGGEVVYQGSFSKLVKQKRSLTSDYMFARRSIARSAVVSKIKPQAIKVTGCSANNLKNITVEIPLVGLVVVAGVSGSGKSSFVENCLFAAYKAVSQGANPKDLLKEKDLPVETLSGIDFVDEIVLIDQSPVGKTPRANPATYTKAWELIRNCLAETSQAQSLALNASAFSFNVDGGRCLECKGAGKHKVEMQFLADVYVDCEVCGGKRFQEKVLEVRYFGKSVTDFLAMPIQDAVGFFETYSDEKNAKEICSRLQPLLDLGLGYLSLGHPLSHLSGGEAQRLKLASFMGDIKDEKRALVILDEPTTGLHFHNVQGLLTTFDKLIERGHSILCIEHNLDVINAADWIIEIGPDGGDAGGYVVAEGTPKDFKTKAKIKKASQTSSFLIDSDKSRAVKERDAGKLKKNKPQDEIRIVGAKHHNLKNVSLSINKDAITVITGVSGSGKSSLAFDIIFAEGQRRYIDCLSPYARQFIKQLERADVDKVESIPPTVALSQKTAPPLGVSTIATTTEIYQYLRLLYAKVGILHCPKHDVAITAADAKSLASKIQERYAGKRLFLYAPVVSGRKGYHNELFRRALAADIYEARVDDSLVKLSEDLRLERHKLHWVSLLVASVTLGKKSSDILIEAIEQCLLLGGGTVEVAVEEKGAEFEVFSSQRLCPECGQGFHELDPQDFSFRSHRGVCHKCGGRGVVGLESHKKSVCPSCDGARISEIGRSVFVGGKRIDELTKMTAPGLIEFFQEVEFEQRLEPIVRPLVDEVLSRLRVIVEVGLDYLELDRESSSVSGGEAQRLRLARTLGSPLTGVCYVLDEPTIGLHPSEHEKLMQLLRRLRDAGNTVIVVEHDEDTIRAADQIIDVGPSGGRGGGEIVAQGSVSQLKKCKESATGAELRKREKRDVFQETTEQHSLMSLAGAHYNNLQDVDLDVSLKALNVVVGVSGAGKSSLVHGCLVPALIDKLEGNRPKKNQRSYDKLLGADEFQRYVEVDQSPVGKTSTSTPASFLKILGDLRKLYASLPEAQIRGWNSSYFSFNSGKGRCRSCEGRGFIKAEMSFLPDATSLCEACNGLRFEPETLEVKYQGLSIGDALKLTLSEAHDVFKNHKLIRRALGYASDLGIGYIQLGQPTHTLSGGEAQRLKIARELGTRNSVDTLYVLDEPTTGLHMSDVSRLISVLKKLVDNGNTVVVIEHDLDVVAAADRVIEVGPGSGSLGGRIVFSGHPSEMVSKSVNTVTSKFMAMRQGK